MVHVAKCFIFCGFLGRKIFRRDDLVLAQERKPELNKYMTELLQLKESVSRSKLVLDFFARQDISENMDVKDSLVDMKKENVVSKSPSGIINQVW